MNFMKWGLKSLPDKLGASEVPRFIRQCKLGKGDYSVDRHKLLANQPDIDTIVKRIQGRRDSTGGGGTHARAEKVCCASKRNPKNGRY